MQTSTGQFGGGTSAPAPTDMSAYGIPPLGAVPQPSKVPQPGFVPQPGANAPNMAPYIPPRDEPSGVMPGMGQIPSSTPNPLPMTAQSAQPQGAPSLTAYGENKFGVHPHVDLSGIADYLINAHHGVESKNIPNPYTARTKLPESTASGKYQYLKSTWNNFEGYPEAALAPPDVQERRMRQDVMARLHRFGGDPFKAAAEHYYPAYASDPTKWDSPILHKGKPVFDKKGVPRATVREYLSHIFPPSVLDKYAAQYASAPAARRPRG